MHLHLSETAEKLEEAQADITRRVVIIARKETVKYAFRRALRNPDRTNVFGNVCAPQPWLGSPHLPGVSQPGMCVRGWGLPSPSARCLPGVPGPRLGGRGAIVQRGAQPGPPPQAAGKPY